MMKGISKLLAAGVLLLVGSGAQAAVVKVFDNAGDIWLSNSRAALLGTYFNTDTTAPEMGGWSFDVTKEMRFNIIFGTSDITGQAGNSGVGDTHVSLTTLSGTSTGYFDMIGQPSGSVTYNGILDVGSYHLNMSSKIGGLPDLGGSYSVAVLTSAVPVPGAAILFGSAVMAFGFVSRRRKGMAA